MAKNTDRHKRTNSKTGNYANRLDGRGVKRLHVPRASALRSVIVLAFCGVLAVLVSPTVTLPTNWPTEADYGTPQKPRYANRDILATLEFTTEDVALTEKARREAAAKVLPVYAFDGEILRDALQKVNVFLAVFDKFGEGTTLSLEEKLRVLEKELGLLAEMGVLQDKISREVAETWLRSVTVQETAKETALAEEQNPQSKQENQPRETTAAPESRPTDYRFDALSQNVRTLLQSVLEEGIIAKDAGQQILSERGPDAQVRLVKLRGEVKEKVIDVASLRRVDEARTEVLKRARKLYADDRLTSAIGAVASQFIAVTLAFDKEETEKQQLEAAAKVAPLPKVVRHNQLIIEAGTQWTAQARREIEDYKKAVTAATGVQRRLRASTGNIILLVLLMLGLARCLAVVAPSVYASPRQVTLLLLAITIMVGMAKLLSILDLSGYLVPVAAVPILLAILMGRGVGLLSGATLAVLVSIIYGNDWNVLAVAMAGSLAGVLGVVNVRKRSDLVRPGMLVGLVTIIVVIALGFVSDTLRFSKEGLTSVGDAAINGLLVTLIVPGTLSLLESAFRITTDIQLLELSDLYHPILRRMTMEAPGTHHHSLMVGNLAEVAAEAIGANSLLARVCSYYHDIGKLTRPDYFSENQTDHNKHDGLSPVMSSRIIAGHVKDGLELAREHALCQPVIDIIQQHHGTDLIRFFYEKAIREDKHNCVRDEDFRYPGPKPQSREAAVVMVADSIESASRSLTNVTGARLKAVADKIINTRFADGQFDNCDLTLKDLHAIAETIVRVLMSAHHKRVEYPEQESPKLVTRSKTFPAS